MEHDFSNRCNALMRAIEKIGGDVSYYNPSKNGCLVDFHYFGEEEHSDSIIINTKGIVTASDIQIPPTRVSEFERKVATCKLEGIHEHAIPHLHVTDCHWKKLLHALEEVT